MSAAAWQFSVIVSEAGSLQAKSMNLSAEVQEELSAGFATGAEELISRDPGLTAHRERHPPLTSYPLLAPHHNGPVRLVRRHRAEEAEAGDQQEHSLHRFVKSSSTLLTPRRQSAIV